MIISSNKIQSYNPVNHVNSNLRKINSNSVDTFSFQGKKVKNDLDKYVLPKSFFGKEKFKVQNHKEFSLNKENFNGRTPIFEYWSYFKGQNPNICAWKMHIYADNEADWQKLVLTCGKYLIDKNIDWKTLNPFNDVESLNKDERQKGKVITIYPASVEDFKNIAKDLNYIIKNNNLKIQDTKINGDRELGDTGRLFYRYSYKSGKDHDVTLNKDCENFEYQQRILYRRSAIGGSHLADDMTPADDPFYNFNPDC